MFHFFKTTRLQDHKTTSFLEETLKDGFLLFLKLRNSESQNLRISEIIREILVIRGGFKNP